MGRKSDISAKIQFLSNRVRCSSCNADSTEALFVITEELKFRRSVFKPTSHPPMFIRGKHMRLNRTQELENTEFLTRVCLRCGTARKTGIPNI